MEQLGEAWGKLRARVDHVLLQCYVVLALNFYEPAERKIIVVTILCLLSLCTYSLYRFLPPHIMMWYDLFRDIYRTLVGSGHSGDGGDRQEEL